MNDRQAAEFYAKVCVKLEIYATFFGFLLVCSVGLNIYLIYQLASKVCP